MGFALGRPPLADGTGTSPTDMQRIIGSSFLNPGIVPGVKVGAVKGTTAMSYAVDPCTVFLYADTSSRLGYLVPTEATTVATDPAPSTGTRKDTVYVDAGGAVRVAMGFNPPSGAVALGEFIVPAGATSTQSIANTLDRKFAIPSGASLGRLLHWDGTGITEWTETSPKARFSGRFVLPTDRIVRLEQIATLTTPDAATDLPHYVAFTYKIDGTEWVKRAYFQADPTRQTRTISMSLELAAGPHDLVVETHIRSFNGGTDNITKIYVSESFDSALEMSLWDAGVA